MALFSILLRHKKVEMLSKEEDVRFSNLIHKFIDVLFIAIDIQLSELRDMMGIVVMRNSEFLLNFLRIF
jgi:hypothetical protein